jgi:hypothetical protein
MATHPNPAIEIFKNVLQILPYSPGLRLLLSVVSS